MSTAEAPPGSRRAAADSSKAEIRSLGFAVTAYAAVLLFKLVAYWVTDVMALLAEALHTVGDIFVSGFLLVALLWSRKAPDERHMFGYGRAQSAAALAAATLFTSFTALRLYEEAIPRLFRAESADYRNIAVAVAVLVVSMAVAGAPLRSLLLRPSRRPAATAQLWELINDELGLVAALAGTVLAVAGHSWADPLASIVIATIISWKAVALFRQNLCLLIGRSPDRPVLDAITVAARSIPGVTGVHDLRAEYVAPGELHLDMHLEVPRGTPVESADAIATRAATGMPPTRRLLARL